MTNKINVRLLRKIKRHILEEPLRLNMAWWFTKRTRSVRVLIDYDGKPTPFAPCGTAACIAGWAVLLSGEKIKEDMSLVSERGAALLNISEYSADRLFGITSWPTQFKQPYEDRVSTPAQRAKIAAKRMEHFIKTKGRE